jgi:hypothetical protein
MKIHRMSDNVASLTNRDIFLTSAIKIPKGHPPDPVAPAAWRTEVGIPLKHLDTTFLKMLKKNLRKIDPLEKGSLRGHD